MNAPWSPIGGPLTARQSARLTLWRELHARGPLLALLPFLLLMDVILPTRAKGAWDLFALLVVLPPVAVGLALRLPARADLFWRGLGGSSFARALTTLGVQLVPVLATAGLLQLSLFGRGESLTQLVELPFSDLLYPLTLGLLWSLAFAGRAIGDGLQTIVPLLGVGSSVALLTVATLALRRLPVAPILGVRLFVVATVGVLVGLAVEGRLGTWGGAVRRGRPRASTVLALLLGFTALTGVAELLWPPSEFAGGKVAFYPSPEGDRAVALHFSDLHGGAPLRERIWTESAGWRWRKDSDPSKFGPAGSEFYEQGLRLADGTFVEDCGPGAVTPDIAPDGLSAVSLVGDSWVAMTADGCLPLRAGRQALALPGRRALLVTEKRLFAGPMGGEFVEVPVPAPNDESSLTIRSNSGVVFVARVGVWKDRRSTKPPGELWVYSAGRLVSALPWPSDFNLEWAGPCAVADRVLRCWDAEGNEVASKPAGTTFLADGWFHDHTKPAVRHLDGREVLLPDRQYWGRPVVVSPTLVRVFASDGRIHDVELPPPT